ncbi:MAG: Gfo/Idh/MocA family oxidoreductase [Salinibacterium sp.]|nr:Gfo/Idh/MocA family oxidoreductase [Salinibacterium sp.]
MKSLPEPTNTPLRGGARLNWGVLAPGSIASHWVASVHANTDQRVVAVASRTLSRAQEFAAAQGIEQAYGSYEQLVADPRVDAVYIAAPHSEHRKLALLVIAAGKHVIVEKPIALNPAEAQDIVEAARTAGVFAMEAMWTRFLPQMTVVEQLLTAGDLGDVLSVTADFGTRFPFDPESRAFNPALGGGALLDLGVYPAWFAHFVLGAPSAVTATGSLASTGVDAQSAVILDYESDAQAAFTTSLLVSTPIAATINGTLGRVEFPGPFMGPSSFRVTTADREVIDWVEPTGFKWGEGLCYQAVAMAQYIADGLTEAPWHTLDDTLEIMAVLDSARRQLGSL